MSGDEGGEAPCLLPLLDEEGQVQDDYARVRLKRVYEPAEQTDGYRVLVDRLWPRGLRKEQAQLDAWLRELAPSSELRREFGHDPARWDEFRRRYREELAAPERRALLVELRERAAQGALTLLYAARDTAHNNALVVRDALIDSLRGPGATT